KRGERGGGIREGRSARHCATRPPPRQTGAQARWKIISRPTAPTTWSKDAAPTAPRSPSAGGRPAARTTLEPFHRSPRPAAGLRLARPSSHFTARLGRRPACGSHDPRATSPLASARGRPAPRPTLEPFPPPPPPAAPPRL